jgi:hypothetical protein
MDTAQKVNLVAQHPLGALFAYSGYLTTWSLILVLFHKWTHVHFHLVYLTIFVCIGGLFLSNVYPRQYIMPVSKTQSIVWDGWWTVLLDVVLHIIPMMFIIYTYRSYYSKCSNTWKPLANTMALLLLYLFHVTSIFSYLRKEGDVYTMYSLNRRYAAIIMASVIAFTLITVSFVC